MALVTAAALLAGARDRESAVAAFNVVTLEQAEGVVEGAEASGRPAIIQVSENAIRFHAGFAPLLAGCRELAVAGRADIALHVDHLTDSELALAVVGRATELGVGSIMFDAASLGDAINIAQTAAVVRAAHSRGLWVEGELGEVGGKGGAHALGVRTDPAQAARYVAETAVDGLAVAVGSSHAMLTQTASVDPALIARLAAAVSVPLVLHGSSGVPDAGLSSAVRAGIRKVNIGTALAVAYTRRLRAELADQPDAYDPRAYLGGIREAVATTVADYLRVVTKPAMEHTCH